ncbi:hypothetical protein MtrunA17_Chr5g0423481 [Medicago truncatula]|uniref:Transmembrane protein, putative n=1 Tax=Medicago truncatula TaxID=3880 RepID=A0A072UDY3_MEDTR|nr:transmembrane protein, putative [Medicago truncatula]RHN55902.1 hypothetical protein MtrunA17_Chr5g0423481 [Medicago truncatula]
MSTIYPPPSQNTPLPPDGTVPVPWSWSPPMPTWPPPISSNGLASDDSSSSSSSTSTFGIGVGVAVGVLGVILLFAIWHKYLRKKSCCSSSSKC